MRLESVTKSFGDKQVLCNLSVDIPEGKTTLISGPSGSGKTTLLRIISELDKPDSGNIISPNNTVISFMFQEPRLFPWLNVTENVTAVLQKPNKERAEEILEKLGLGNDLKSIPDELSGGMKRRVALARTLIFPADLYLFDEPFAGLDPNTAKKAAEIIAEYTTGKTVIIVSHDNSMLSDEINVLTIGKTEK